MQKRKQLWTWIVAGWLSSAPAFTAAPEVTTTDDYLLTNLAQGVVVLRHKRAAEMGATSGNTTIVVGEKAVLVVDSPLLPSLARSDIEFIRALTDKPVRYLVNTHWHGDHSWGNGAYLAAFPDLVVIAHHETARLMMGYLPNFLPGNTAYPAKLRAMLESGLDAEGKPLTAAARAEIVADLPNRDRAASEYATLVTHPPSVTFESTLEIDLGGRTVVLRHLGRGNTSGDVVAHLPVEGIVAAGDLLVYPVPYTLGGFPREWARTLEELAQLGATSIVPGHGAVLADGEASDYLAQVTTLLGVVASAVEQEAFRRGNGPEHLAAVEAAVRARSEVLELRSRWGAGDAERESWFDSALGQLVAAAYREVWGS